MVGLLAAALYDPIWGNAISRKNGYCNSFNSILCIAVEKDTNLVGRYGVRCRCWDCSQLYKIGKVSNFPTLKETAARYFSVGSLVALG